MSRPASPASHGEDAAEGGSKLQTQLRAELAALASPPEVEFWPAAVALFAAGEGVKVEDVAAQLAQQPEADFVVVSAAQLGRKPAGKAAGKAASKEAAAAIPLAAEVVAALRDKMKSEAAARASVVRERRAKERSEFSARLLGEEVSTGKDKRKTQGKKEDKKEDRDKDKGPAKKLDKKAAAAAAAEQQAREEQEARELAEAQRAVAEFAQRQAALPRSAPLHVLLVDLVTSEADAVALLEGGVPVQLVASLEAKRDDKAGKAKSKEVEPAAEPVPDAFTQLQRRGDARFRDVSVTSHVFAPAEESAAEFALRLARKLRELSAASGKFAAWRSGARTVRLDSGVGGDEAVDRRLLDHLLGELPDSAASPAAVLAALVEQVAANAEEDAAAAATATQRVAERVEEWVAKAASARLPASSAAGAPQPVLIRHGEEARKGLALDALWESSAATKTAAAVPPVLEAAERCEQRAAWALIGARPDAPSPLSEAERGAQRTQLYSRSRVAPEALERALLASELQSLAEEFEAREGDVRREWRVEEWLFEERMAPQALARALLGAAAASPLAEVRSRYLPRQDVWLVAAHVHTPLQRKRSVAWEGFVCPDLSLAQWLQAQAWVRERPPRVMYELSGRHSGVVQTRLEAAFPADQTVLGLTASPATPTVWLDKDGHRVEIGADGDGSVLRARWDGGGATTLADSDSISYSLPFFSATLRRDGSVELRTRGGSDNAPRVVRPDGSVSRLGETLRGDGSVERAARQTQAAQPAAALLTDPETRARVTVREDLVMVVEYENGARLAQHADGTRIFFAPALDETVVECADAVPVAFRRHAAAEQGGLEVRVALPDGSSLQRRANGSMHLLLATGLSLVVHASSGCGVLVPEAVPLAALPPEVAQGTFAASAVPKGVYYLEWGRGARGLITTTDAENNTFVADRGAARLDAVLCRHKGADASAPIGEFIPAQFYPPPANPLPPRLFVVERDGSGYELLHRRDVDRFLQRHLRDPNFVLLPQEAADAATAAAAAASGAAKSLRFLHHLAVARGYAKPVALPEVLKASRLSPVPQPPDARRGPQYLVFRSLLERRPLAEHELRMAREAATAAQQAVALRLNGEREFAAVQSAQTTAGGEDAEQARLVEAAVAARRQREEQRRRAEEEHATAKAAEVLAPPAPPLLAAFEAQAAQNNAAREAEEARAHCAELAASWKSRRAPPPDAPASESVRRAAAETSARQGAAPALSFFGDKNFAARFELHTWLRGVALPARGAATVSSSSPMSASETRDALAALQVAEQFAAGVAALLASPPTLNTAARILYPTQPPLLLLDSASVPPPRRAPLLQLLGFRPGTNGTWFSPYAAAPQQLRAAEALRELARAETATLVSPPRPRSAAFQFTQGGDFPVHVAARDEQEEEDKGDAESKAQPLTVEVSPPASPPAEAKALEAKSPAASSSRGRFAYTGAPSPRAAAAASSATGFILSPARAELGELVAGRVYRMTLTLTNATAYQTRVAINKSALLLRSADGAPLQMARLLFRPGPLSPGLSLRLELEVYAARPGPLQCAFCVRGEAGELTLPVTATVVPRDDEALQAAAGRRLLMSAEGRDRAFVSPQREFGKEGRVRLFSDAPPAFLDAPVLPFAPWPQP